MICSWFDHQTPTGIFFREQAMFLSEEYDFTLVKFNEETKGFRTFFKRVLHKNRDIKSFNISEGIDVIYINSVRWWFFGNLFLQNQRKRTVIRLFRYLRKNNISIELVHAQGLFDAGIWAYCIKLLKGIPYLITEHNQISFLGKSTKIWRLSKEILRNSSANLVVSLDKIRQFAANGIFADFYPIGNAVNERVFNYQNKAKITNEFVITTIGAFTKIKDQKTMVEALALLQSKNYQKKIVFNWIGYDAWGGQMESNVKNVIKALDNTDIRVNLFNLLDRFEIAELLNTSDLFLFTSISEGMPVSVLEALACGVPVCTTNCGGVDEVINDDNGIIVKIKDVEAITEFIFKLMSGNVFFNRKFISESAILKFGSNAFKLKLGKIYGDILG